ncbi:MAG: hypothetical protein GX998_09855 [Firmicutes bacterium]|nr:hypothetical protein [Bacillota bacterium]
MRPFVFLYSAASILLLWKAAPVHRARLLRSIGDLSFGIYFVHLAIRNLLKEAAESFFYSDWLGGSLAFWLVLALSYGLVWLISRDENGWILVGKTSSRKRQSMPITTREFFSIPVAGEKSAAWSTEQRLHR